MDEDVKVPRETVYLLIGMMTALAYGGNPLAQGICDTLTDAIKEADVHG